MKIQSNTLTSFRIVPECDSERLIMDQWTTKNPWIQSHGAHCDLPGCHDLTITFKERSPGLSEVVQKWRNLIDALKAVPDKDSVQYQTSRRERISLLESVVGDLEKLS